jgi:spore maturation protein CgeB
LFKLLCLVPTIEVRSTLGAAPYLNQLLNSMKASVELEVVETRSMGAPSIEKAYIKYLTRYGKPYSYAKAFVRRAESLQPDAMLIIHDFRWLRKGNAKLLQNLKVPLFFYDLEMPLNLPEYMKDKRYGISPWNTVDLSDMDGVIIPSKGSETIVRNRLRAKRVLPLYFSVDPSWYPTERMEKAYDVSYLGMSTYYRENAITELVTKPSIELPDLSFKVSSRNDFDFGRASVIHGSIDYDSYVTIPRKSKINLSITRAPFTEIYASSVSRPFELAAMKCCIVSNQCLGMEEWFKEGDEILTAGSSEKAIELYKWLSKDDAERERLGENAYQKVVKEHTVSRKAIQLLEFIGVD